MKKLLYSQFSNYFTNCFLLISLIFASFLQVNAQNNNARLTATCFPKTEDFSSFGSVSYQNTQVSGCITYSCDNAPQGNVGIDDASSVSGGPIISGKCVIISLNSGSPGPTYAKVASTTNTNNFKLASANVEFMGHNQLSSEKYNIIGYDDGSVVVTVNNFNVKTSGTYGTGNDAIVYSRNSFSNFGNNTGSLSFGTSWQNIDEVRFVIADASPNNNLYVGLDNIVFQSPIVPLTLADSPTITFSNNTGFSDNIAQDGEGGSVAISDFDIQIYPINSAAVKLTASNLEYHDGTQNGWTGYPAIITYGGVEGNYGWVIKNAEGNDFSLKALSFLDWGGYTGDNFIVEGFNNGTSKGSIVFAGNKTGDLVQLSTGQLTASKFNNVDEVRVYKQGGADFWGALNNVKVSSPVAPTPVITSTATFSTFTSCSGTVSGEQSFTVSGTDLTANLVATAPTGYEVSLTSVTGFASSVNVVPTTGVVSNKTVYVRLSSVATGNPSGNIVLSSTGATDKTVALTGTVSNTPSAPSLTSVSRCSTGTVSFTQAVRLNAPAPYKLYDAASAGAVVGSGLTTPSISSTTDFWATQTVGACESARTKVTATVKQPSSTILNETACDKYFFNGVDRTTSGTYTQTLTNKVGCDSVVTLNLTINTSPSAPNLASASRCSTGTVTFNVVAPTRLSAIPPYKLYDAASAGAVVGSGLTTPSISSTTDFWATVTLNGCESARTKVTATVKQATASSMSKTACDSYVFGTKTLTVSGTYKDTIPNATGCDSVRTLNLTINVTPDAPTWLIADPICVEGTVTFMVGFRLSSPASPYKLYDAASNGSLVSSDLTTPSITETTDFWATYSDNGCESARTKVTAVVNSNPNAPTWLYADPICGEGYVTLMEYARTAIPASPYKLYDAETDGNEVSTNLSTPFISQTTDFWATYTNEGCESARTKVTVTVKQPSTSSLSETACDSYVFGTKTLTTSGVYKDTIPNAVGCDSVRTLNLTINTTPTMPTLISNPICNSGTVTFNEVAPGRLAAIAPYRLYNASVSGNVVGNALTTPTISQNTDFWATVTLNGCESARKKVTATVNPLPTVSITVTPNDTINEGESITLAGKGATSYTWNNDITDNVAFNPTLSGLYKVVGKDANNCTNADSINIVVNKLTAIESSNSTNFSIYPNPATDNVTITFTELVSGTVSIVDLKGNVVATKSISGNTSNISTADLASGVYVVKISSDKGVAVKQLVIN